jgi:hypothetical protein
MHRKNDGEIEDPYVRLLREHWRLKVTRFYMVFATGSKVKSVQMSANALQNHE